MLTQNGRNAIAGQIASLVTNNPGRLPIVDKTGTTYYYVGTSGSNRSWPQNQSHGVAPGGNYGIVFGSGDTPAALSDYKLASEITSGLSGAVTDSTGIDGNGNIYLNLDIVLTNTSSSDITIKEIGWCGTLYCSTSVGATTGAAKYALVERTVLETPVTIAAGEYETIRYRITPAW